MENSISLGEPLIRVGLVMTGGDAATWMFPDSTPKTIVAGALTGLFLAEATIQAIKYAVPKCMDYYESRKTPQP